MKRIAVSAKPKLLELLSELVPQAGVIAVLVNPDNQNTERNIADVQEASRAKARPRPHYLNPATSA